MTAKRTFTLTLVSLAGVLFAAPSFAQNAYVSGDKPVTFGVPDAPSVRVQDDRSTELGDTLDGLSLVIEAQGRFERFRSEALVNLQQAERLRLQNIVERERAKAEVARQRAEIQQIKAERIRLTRQISLERQARMKPTVVVSRNGSIQWIDALKKESLAAYRAAIDQNVAKLSAVRTVEEREQVLEALNFNCQELIEALAANKDSLSTNEYDAGRRFVIRLYDDLQEPAAFVLATTLSVR